MTQKKQASQKKHTEEPGTKGSFLMIDGSSLLFRAFYAIRDLRTRDGIYTNGVYGFLTMFWKVVEEVDPAYIVVAFDRPEPSFRVEVFAEYKGNRTAMPPELGPQFGIVKDLLKALGVRTIDRAGFEADDLIGTLSRQAEEAGLHAILLTGDRDYFQLASDQTTIYYTKRGISELESVDPAYIREKYEGLEAKDLIELKGLQGDSSDNIPGVPGIGEKTAIKLIAQFGSIEGLYEHIEEVSGAKRKENLLENRDLAFLSRRLGTICRTVDLSEDLSFYKPQAADRPHLTELFERLEFQTFAERFALDDSKKASPSFEGKWLAPPAWPSLAQKLMQKKRVPFFLLSDGPQYLHDKPSFAGFLLGKEALLLAISGQEAAFQKAFAPVFGPDGPTLLAYDIKESLVLLGRMGIEGETAYEDLMLMAYLIDPNRSDFDPSELAEGYTSFALKSRAAIVGKGAKQKKWSELDREALSPYFAGLLHTLEEAHDPLWSQVEAQGMSRLFREIENPLAQVLARMERTGVGVNRSVLEGLGERYRSRLEALEKTIYDYAGRSFNINSSQQLSQVLFEELGIKPGKKTQTGYSTAADVLEKRVGDHPIIEALLDYRMLAKLISTYVDGFLPYIDEDDRVRSQFKQNAAATGRLSSTEPNLQNIPVRTEEGRKLRSVFEAGPGRVLIDSDYSQIELRVLASLAGDESMIHAFESGLDIHRKTASEILHKDLAEVTDEERSSAKAVNFGIIYGISDYGLSQNLGIGRQEAKDYIEGYKATYPAIRTYMDELVAQAREKGYVETYYGRRRPIPELASKNFTIRSFGERMALNTPIQGTAADLIKLAMIHVDGYLKAHHSTARLVLQVHDELIVEVEEEEAASLAKEIKRIMEEVVHFPVPLCADTGLGKSWYEAK